MPHCLVLPVECVAADMGWAWAKVVMNTHALLSTYSIQRGCFRLLLRKSHDNSMQEDALSRE